MGKLKNTFSIKKNKHMPLIKANKKSNVQKAISKNISELTHKGTKKRSHNQIVAIAIRAAKGK